MTADFFTVCARFYYQLLRLLRFNDLYYNETLKRVENQPRNPCIRRFILSIYYSISGIYAANIIATILIAIFILSYTTSRFEALQVVYVIYVIFIKSVYITTFFIISYQLQSKRTSKFLKRFFNELFALQRISAELTGRRAILETHIKLLWLFKLMLIVWILVASYPRYSILSNLLGFPIFELAFMAYYLIIKKMLLLHQDLKKRVSQQEAQYSHKSQCTAACKTRSAPIRVAITLWSQARQLLSEFRKNFNWYEKLVLLENIYCVYLANQFIVCVFYKQYYHGALLPDALNHILNMHLIGMVNDALKYDEDAFNDIMTILVAKLSHQTRLCGDCRQLLKAIDMYFCHRNIHPNGIELWGCYWTREFVMNAIEKWLILGVSITQFGSDMIYFCHYDPENSPVLKSE